MGKKIKAVLYSYGHKNTTSAWKNSDEPSTFYSESRDLKGKLSARIPLSRKKTRETS